MKISIFAGRALVAICLATLTSSGALAQNVGSVGAVNQGAKGTRPGGGAQVLSLGSDVVHQERVETDANGTAQIAFSDRSAMSVGRGSSVVIDKFVFDPSSGAGAMTTRLARGALRFVGGQISHGDGATIQTSTATIGVRGGVVTVVSGGQGAALRVILHYGVVNVRNGGGVQTISQPGYEILVPNAGDPPGAAHPVDQAILASVMARFASTGRQTGGAVTLPSDADAARFGVGSPRPDAQTPNFDLPAVIDSFARGRTDTGNATVPPAAPPSRGTYYPCNAICGTP